MPKAHLSEQLPDAALALIPDGTRWTIANALRAAADKFDANAKEPAFQVGPYRELIGQFEKQAEEARDLAERFENC